MIYIHVPFCKSFCTYCDFYSELSCGYGAADSLKSYMDGIRKEISARRDEIGSSRDPHTLYIGGGTPSVLPLDLLSELVREVGTGPFEEFTVEVNPEDIVEKGVGYARALRELGVSRVSMGVQSLDDGVLSWMRRRHNSQGALKAFSILREAGFDNISVDVIFGLSILENKVLEDTLRTIAALRPEHISAYQLTVEDGSDLSAMIRDGRYCEASDEYCRAQYDLICGVLGEHGYRHYEISNWALPGRESIHNSAYWKRKPYVGLGPGAHSFSIEGGVQKRSWNSCDLRGWTSSFEILSPKEIEEERLMLGLRTAEGVDGRRLSESEFFVADAIISDLLP